VTQSAEHRRLVRLSGAMNSKAARLGVMGRVTVTGLMWVEEMYRECNYCGISLEAGQGTFDHVVPYDRGGHNVVFNLVRCCIGCNRRKFTKTPQQLRIHDQRSVTCARPGCGNTYQPRWAEWEAGRARLCSRRCSALWRYVLAERGA